MHDGELVVASGSNLFAVAGLVFNLAMLATLRRRWRRQTDRGGSEGAAEVRSRTENDPFS